VKSWRVATACALLLSSLVRAQETKELPSTSGNVFLRLCSSIDKDERSATEAGHLVECVAYTEGVIDGVVSEAAYVNVKTGKETPEPYCLPKAESGQLVRIVLKYIRNHPEEAHQPTAFLIVVALQEAFPCATEKKGNTQH